MTAEPAGASTDEMRVSETSRMGMYLFLVTLGMLFASSMVGYLIIWSRSEVWGNPGGQTLPGTLWISTLVLIFCSLAHHAALKAVREDRLAALRHWLFLAMLMGAAFLVSQGYSWYLLIESHLPPNARNLYAFSFYMLTTLHALHVLGGLIGLVVVWCRARVGAYSAHAHAAIWRNTAYWHFLDAVWLVLFATLLLTVR